MFESMSVPLRISESHPSSGIWWVQPHLKIAFENGGFFCLPPSLPAVPSVARKDTTLTDAPKGTWPFSVDSDSSWSQLRAAQRAPLLGACIEPFNASVGATLARAGRQARRGYRSEGLRLSVSLSFCCNLFLKGDKCSSLVLPSWHHVCLASTPPVRISLHMALWGEEEVVAKGLC